MRVFFLLITTWCIGSLLADENIVQHTQSLADRGQFAAVEAFCQEQFERTDLTDLDKIKLATELVRSRSMQLLTIEPARRAQFIERLTRGLTIPAHVHESADGAMAELTFQLQLAMAHQSLGEYQRLEAEAVSTTLQKEAYRQARTTILLARDRLKECQQELQTFRQQIGINADTPLQQQMSALDDAITMQQGIVQKSLALTHSVESDRHYELRRAAEMLSALASRNSIDSTIVQCKIAKAACHRLCGELEKCREILTPLLTLPQVESRLRTQSEWIRLLIAEKQISQARQQFAAERPEASLFPEYHLAQLELFLASDTERNIRPDHVVAARLQETMERELGAYWGRRARMAVSTLSGSDTELVSAEMLKTLADNQFRENRFAESAELYEQAAAKADAHQQAENLFLYRRLAIAAWSKALELLPDDSPKIDYQTRLIVLLKNLSVQNPDHPEAVQLHLAAIDIQRQITTTQPESASDFITLIQEHLQTWKESPQTQPLRRLLVILLERQGRLEEAATLLPLLDAEQLETLTPEIQRLRVRQLDSEGKTQEALNILTVLLKQKREPATLQLIAEILSRQSDEKSLRYALDFWMQLERRLPKDTETWWVVREGILEVLCKLNRRDDAKESFKILRTLYPALGGEERKKRLLKRFE